jgi:hypothetical protein
LTMGYLLDVWIPLALYVLSVVAEFIRSKAI